LLLNKIKLSKSPQQKSVLDDRGRNS